MGELLLHQARDGSEDEECARVIFDRGRQVGGVHSNEVAGRPGSRRVDGLEVVELVERADVDIGEVGRQVGDVDLAPDGGVDRRMVGGPVSLRDEPYTCHPLVPRRRGDDVRDGLLDGRHPRPQIASSKAPGVSAAMFAAIRRLASATYSA